MSASRQYRERGGFADHATSDLYDFGAGHPATTTATTSSSNTHATTEHDYRFPRRPAGGGSQQQQQQYREPYFPLHNEDFHNIEPRASGVEDRLDFSARPAEVARKEMLRETIFPTWKDGSGGVELDSPDEMQKKDPLATQIWRLYTKTKKQLPNQERMENLTWRMMAMSLRKHKQEEEAAAAR